MPYVATLNETDLDFGKQVTAQLKQNGFPFDGAFWLYDDEADDWRLVIVTELVDQIGRQQTYLRLGSIISSVQRSPLQVLNVTVMSPQTATFVALKKRFESSKAVEGIRLQHDVVNGVSIPAAYLYEIR